MVRIVEIDRLQPQAELLAEAGDVLQSGGLVIVPTETVYGIACNPAVPGAMAKLAAAKGRAPGRRPATGGGNGEGLERRAAGAG